MNISIEFSPLESQTGLEWQQQQEVNLFNEQGLLIAKAELELITLNKHRGAKGSLAILEEAGASDWELPLSLYFTKQNISGDLAQQLTIKTDSKKAKSHIMIEALSVLPAYRHKGLAKQLLIAIAQQHPKVQSVNVLTMPMHLFVDAQQCDDEITEQYYQSLALDSDTTTSEQLNEFFSHLRFTEFTIDEKLLAQPLGFNVLVASPEQLLK